MILSSYRYLDICMFYLANFFSYKFELKIFFFINFFLPQCQMKNSLDISEREDESDKLLKKNEILLNKLYALDRPEGQISSQSSGNVAEIKWSIKEKLFLVSFVLINGDSNWSYVSEQLNKWIESISTSKFESNLNKRTVSVSK